MSAELIYQTDKIALYAALDWRALQSTSDAAWRESARDLSATHSVRMVQSEAGQPQDEDNEDFEDEGKKKKKKKAKKGDKKALAGFFTPSALNDESTAPPKIKGSNPHSLAAAFVLWTRDEHPFAALHVRIQLQDQPDRFAVVVAVRGQVVLDGLFLSEEEARKAQLASRKQYISNKFSVFADNEVLYSDTQMSDGLLEAITTECNKQTQIVKIPANLAAIFLVTVLIVGVVGGFGMWKKHEKEVAAQKAAAERIANDPVLQYKRALKAATPNVGVTRETLTRALGAYQLPVGPAGWTLDSISCFAGNTQVCKSRWKRAGGTQTGLLSSLSSFKVDGKEFQVSPQPILNINEATLEWDGKPVVQALEPSSLPDLAQFSGVKGSESMATVSMLQTWNTAGLTITMGNPQLWPNTSGAQKLKFKPKVLSGDFTINGVKLPQAAEVIKTAPENIVWTSLEIKVSGDEIKAMNTDSKFEPLSKATVTIKGKFYVQE